jgi:Universal stress protein family.
MDEGGFGTVVIGRRGVSKAEEFLFGSVSTKVMHLAKDCAVWVVA